MRGDAARKGLASLLANCDVRRPPHPPTGRPSRDAPWGAGFRLGECWGIPPPPPAGAAATGGCEFFFLLPPTLTRSFLRKFKRLPLVGNPATAAIQRSLLRL
jgi:hypothetical protein